VNIGPDTGKLPDTEAELLWGKLLARVARHLTPSATEVLIRILSFLAKL
jgi:hypothetical protein